MKIVIVDLKLQRNNGRLYCRAIDHETGETIISADLEYVMTAVKNRGYEVVDAQDVLEKIALNFKFYKD